MVNDLQKSVASEDVERLQSAESNDLLSLLAVSRVTGKKTLKLTLSATVLGKHQQRRRAVADFAMLSVTDASYPSIVE